MKEFYTRELHGKAQKFPLYDPFGNKTKKYLMIVGSDSDYFSEAQSGALARINEGEFKGVNQMSLMVACAVSGGNITKDFSYDDVVTLFNESPYIRNDVNKFIADHGNFLAKK